MGELGEDEIDFHKQVGKYIAEKYPKTDAKFITVGNLASQIGKELITKNLNVKTFDDNIETSRYILDNLRGDCTIFLKASRAMKFEEIIDYIKNVNKTGASANENLSNTDEVSKKRSDW